jgi:hypothetical protein
VDRVKGLHLTGIYSRGKLDNSSKPNQIRAKGSSPEKQFITKRKNCSLFLRAMLKKGVVDVGDDDEK